MGTRRERAAYVSRSEHQSGLKAGSERGPSEFRSVPAARTTSRLNPYRRRPFDAVEGHWFVNANLEMIVAGAQHVAKRKAHRFDIDVAQRERPFATVHHHAKA